MSYTYYTIKIALDDDLRRLNFDQQPGTDGGLSFSELEAQTRELFEIPASTKLRFTYVDCDDDVVTMVNDRDLKDASVGQRLNPLRMKVAPLEQRKQTSPVLYNYEEEQEEQENSEVYNTREVAVDVNQQVHTGVSCNCCRMNPIIGLRYCSTTWANYNICSACYQKIGHYSGEYEIVAQQVNQPPHEKTPPVNQPPVDPVADAQAAMEALALQRMQHQNQIALMRQQQYYNDALCRSMVDGARAVASLID
ncbi:hypothetical protein R1flu_004141 [Riccia fluitans]|uniref:ZZ-type domain-containing protein n=1 Tax=Riccia fluitans TaxID=41844 RepID=A0ABD1YTE4_9MARC